VTGLLLVYLGVCFAICKSAKVWKQVHTNRSVVLNTKNVLVSNRSIHVQDVFAASVAHDLSRLRLYAEMLTQRESCDQRERLEAVCQGALSGRWEAD